MKSNHNRGGLQGNTEKAVINMSKIQNEIKSQLRGSSKFNPLRCYQYVKDTK